MMMMTLMDDASPIINLFYIQGFNLTFVPCLHFQRGGWPDGIITIDQLSTSSSRRRLLLLPLSLCPQLTVM